MSCSHWSWNLKGNKFIIDESCFTYNMNRRVSVIPIECLSLNESSVKSCLTFSCLVCLNIGACDYQWHLALFFLSIRNFDVWIYSFGMFWKELHNFCIIIKIFFSTKAKPTDETQTHLERKLMKKQFTC